MANAFAQQWFLYHDSDADIVLTDSQDLTAVPLVFEVCSTPDSGVPIVEITPSVTLNVVTITFSKAQTDSVTGILSGERYYGALRRTDIGSAKPIAVGVINLLTAPHKT